MLSHLTSGEAEFLSHAFNEFLQERVIARAEKDAPVEALSAREMDVFRLMQAGLTNREIAEKLFVEVGTVKRHVHSILGKLSARNRTEAASHRAARFLR